jgi:hypothetical protein
MIIHFVKNNCKHILQLWTIVFYELGGITNLKTFHEGYKYCVV